MELRIAIASKKGGVGTSTLARNLAVFLAQVGKRTALIDTGGSLSGAEAFAGLGEREVVRDGPFYMHLRSGLQNLEVYLGTGDREAGWKEVLGRMEHGELEVVISDIRWDGTAFTSRLLRGCPLRILVTSPEPTAIYELYACASALVEDAVEERLRALECPASVRDGIRSGEWLSGFLSPRDAMELTPEGAVRDAFVHVVSRMNIGVIVNMAQEREDFDLGKAIESIGTRVFCLPLVDLGSVERDDAMRSSLRQRLPLLVHMPYSKGGRDLEGIARQLLASPDIDHVRARVEVLPPDREPDHYEALEVDRGSGEHEVRRALRRIQEVFGGTTLASIDLRRPQIPERVIELARDAHRVLLDRKAKREYDRRLLEKEGASGYFARPFGEKPARPAATRPLPVPKEPPEPVPDEGVSGPWLAFMRDRRGMSLDELSSISKVSVTYLSAIEREAFDELPARVYVRGFIVAYARTLNLDADSVASSYLELMQARRL